MTEIIIRRQRAAEAIASERVEPVLALPLGRRDLTVELAETDVHPLSVRLTLWAPRPKPGERSDYRRREAVFLRSGSELDALIEALKRARAKLAEATPRAQAPSGGAIGGTDGR
jgi:hypothetical protein